MFWNNLRDFRQVNHSLHNSYYFGLALSLSAHLKHCMAAYMVAVKEFLILAFVRFVTI